MSPSHFDQTRPAWSARKHAILDRYLRTFCTALSRSTQGHPIWYVDGYAGAGVYRSPNDSSHSEYGSPVLAANIAQELPFDVRCMNIEEDAKNFKSLESETANFPHVRNMQGDFQELIDDVLRIVKDSPVLFFLDSFGAKELPR